MFSPVRLSGAEGVRAMALAPMAVVPERQRAGIGSELVRDGLTHCRRQGFEAVFVVGHPTYYPRFGFSLASGFGVTCEFQVPDEASWHWSWRPVPCEEGRDRCSFTRHFAHPDTCPERAATPIGKNCLPDRGPATTRAG